MLAFWSIAFLLVAAAWLFVLPPLLRRGETAGGAATPLALAVHREQLAELNAALSRGELSAQDHAAERLQIERRVAEDLPATELAQADAAASPRSAPVAPRVALGVALAVALALPLVALSVYALLGQPRSVAPPGVTPTSAAASGPHPLTREQMAAMVERLAERLQTDVADADGWHMLARSYVSFGRYADAAAAYDRAVTLSPRDVQLLSDYADTLAMVNGRNLDGRPTELVNAALKLDPAAPKALALAGTAAFNRREFGAAIGYWQRLLQVLPPSSDGAQRAASSIAQAEAAMAAGGAAPDQRSAQTSAPGTAATISGQLSLGEALRSRLPAQGATLFIFARSVNGPKMPLAALRVPLGALPLRFQLDDSQAMSPQFKLSLQREVMLGARISISGNATPQSGDLMGTMGPVAVGARDVALVIDGVVP